MNTPTPNAAEVFTTEEAAALLKVTPRALRKWRNTGTGPRCTRLGHRTVRYLRADLNAWLVLCKVFPLRAPSLQIKV